MTRMMDVTAIDLGLAIKADRERKKMTLEQVSFKSGVPRTTVWEIENGKLKSVDHRKVRLISKALEVHPSIFYGITEEEYDLQYGGNNCKLCDSYSYIKASLPQVKRMDILFDKCACFLMCSFGFALITGSLIALWGLI